MNKERRNGTTGGMNGGQNNMNGTQGEMNVRRENQPNNMTQGALLEEIRALSFVKTELELYLDTHPTCQKALDYYSQTVDALNSLMERYHEEYGPLVAAGVTNPDAWTWVEMPWPWQVGNGAPEKGGKR